MSDNKNNNVDALKLISVLQDKLRMREDENSMLQARILMLDEQIIALTPEPSAQAEVPSPPESNKDGKK